MNRRAPWEEFKLRKSTCKAPSWQACLAVPRGGTAGRLVWQSGMSDRRREVIGGGLGGCAKELVFCSK